MHNSPLVSGEEEFVEEKTVSSLKGPEQRSCISAVLAPAARDKLGPSVLSLVRVVGFHSMRYDAQQAKR